MRLTLRTMLACLDADDRLDPADAEELATKIEQSKHASDLAQRIRRVVQHPRLSSPRLDGKGMGLDPNSVGEYLDNVLAHDRIAEFERLCLASDIQLAEVSACHQILVLVLEQPAEFEPALRDRIYRIGAESSRRHAEPAASEVRPGPNNTSVRIDRPAEVKAEGATESAPVQPKPKPEVPEYLRAGRQTSLWPLLLAAALAFVVVGLGLRAMGPLDSTHPMARLMRGNTEVAQAPVENNPVPPVTENPEEKKTEELKQPDIVRPLPPDEPETTDMPPELTPDDVNKNKLPDETVPPDMPDVPMDKKPAEPPVPMDMIPAEPMKTTPPVIGEKKPAEPPMPAMDVGKFASEDQVLVRFNAADGQWSRVPSRAQVFVGDELIVFPAFRPQVLLSTSVQLTLSGESRIVMGAIDAEGVSHIGIDYGRLLAANLARGNARLALDLPGLQGTVLFGDADSEIGIEVRKYLPPGMAPQGATSTINVIRLYATRGKITWQEGPSETPGESFVINAGEVRDYVGREAGQTIKLSVLPDWVEGKVVSDIERRAARDLEERLAVDRPLELTLTEMASEMERRAETRALAIRSLAYLDKFEPFIAAFNTEDQKAYWAGEFETLQAAIARSPESAKLVREAFEKLRGAEEGAILFRMLWGYSPEELKSTELPIELVKFLDVDALDFRVFAFSNLHRITGSTQLYRPDFNAARRRTPVAQWTARLREGAIVYKTPPAPINDPK